MKKNILNTLVRLIFLIVFNILFFVITGTKHSNTVWLSYGFMHFSYIAFATTPLFIKKDSNKLVLGFPLYSVSAFYFFVEFVVSLFFMFGVSDSFNLALSIQLILSGIYIALFISNAIANDATNEPGTRQSSEAIYINTLSSEAKILINKAKEKETKKALEKLYDALRSSPTKSSPDVKELEDEISTAISKIAPALKSQNEDLAKENITLTLSLIEKRNVILKSMH